MTFMNLLLLAQTEGAPAAQSAPQNGMLSMVLWLVFLFGFLWFFMIRPQQNEQRRRQAMWDGIKVYDKIVTVGGIHGVVTAMNQDEGTLTLRIDESDNVKVKLEISCVAMVISEKDDAQK